VAFVLAVPGLAPGACMGIGLCRHKSPQRELGDCGVAHQLNTARLKRHG
jgi:hypothetical protein